MYAVENLKNTGANVRKKLIKRLGEPVKAGKATVRPPAETKALALAGIPAMATSNTRSAHMGADER